MSRDLTREDFRRWGREEINRLYIDWAKRRRDGAKTHKKG